MLHNHELPLQRAMQHDLPGLSLARPRARLATILGLGYGLLLLLSAALALNCRSCTDAAFIYGALNESHIYYTDTGLTMGTG